MFCRGNSNRPSIVHGSPASYRAKLQRPSDGNSAGAASMPASRGENLPPWQHTSIGALAGFIEVCVMQPTVGVKNALQEGRPIPRSPLKLYRGLTVSLQQPALDPLPIRARQRTHQ